MQKSFLETCWNVRDSFRKIVVTKDAVPAHYDDGILTMNVYDFLLAPASLRR